MRAVLDDPEIRIWARNPEAAEQLAGEIGATVSPSVDAALFGAEVVCTTTAAKEPIVEKRWLAHGRARERRRLVLPDDARARHGDRRRTPRSSPTVASRASTRRATTSSRPRRARSGPAHIKAELGEVLAGMHPGREHEDELTVFESLGIAVEDLASAELVVRRARERGVGAEVDF